MSGGVRREKESTVPQSGGQIEGRLKVTIAVWNERTKLWVTPKLNPTENRKVESAIKTIRQLGANAAAWKAFDQQGTVLEMTEDGIFVKEADGWKNLLTDQAGESAGVLKTLKTAVNAITGGKKKKSINASTDVAANAKALDRGEVVIQVEVTSTPLAASLSNYQEFNEEMTERIGTFVNAYQGNRELFESVMRKHGISDLGSAFIFNHFVPLYAALQEWDEAFQKLVDLANTNEYEAALEAFTVLIKDDLPKLLEKVRNVHFAAERFNAPQVQKAFQKFAIKAGLPDAQQILDDLSNIKKIGQVHQLNFVESIKKAREAGIPVAEEAGLVSDQLKDRLRTEEDALPIFNSLFVQNQRLMYFFDHKGLMQAHHPLHKQWKDIRNKHGWSLEKITAFTNLTNQYAAHIRPLKQAQQAINMEADPTKKRALQAQLKELARKVMPQINQLHRELQKHGGLGQLRLLSQAARELYSPKSDLQTVQGLQKEADGIVGLIEERIAYVNKLYNDLGLVAPPTETVSRALLQGPHARDQTFMDVLKDKGWDLAKIQKLSTWYDAYLKEVYPLDRAKRNLDADPENVILQKEFKKVVDKQIPKLNVLSKEFKATFGKKQSLNDLEDAINTYKQKLTDALLDLKNAQKKVGPRYAGVSTEVKNIEASLRMLSSWSISAEFDRNQTFVIEMDRLAKQPMSWDKDFLKELVPNPSSPLMKYSASMGRAPWQKYLEDNKVEKENVESILKLLNKYQQHLEKIMILERKLEAHPEDEDLRLHLINKFSLHINSLQSIDREFSNMSIKITPLEQALRDLKSRLEQDINLMRQAGAGEKGEMLEAAQKTELEARNLLLIVNRLGVLDAFHQKRDFVADLMRRFTRRRTVA